MEKSINIPNSGGKIHFVDKDYLVSLNEELIEFLCNYVSSFKISQLPAQDKSLLSNMMSLIKTLHKNKFQEVMQVMKCLQCSNRELSFITSCNHGFCRECITEHINEQTSGYVVLNDLELIEGKLISPTCPKCENFLIEEDLRTVYGELKEFKDNAKMRQVLVEKDGRSFSCFSCGKLRGSAQFMNKTCGHMCKSCFAQRGCEMMDGTCKVCGKRISEEDCDNHSVHCGRCNGEFYIIGDFMQEVCINQFFCTNCASDMVDRGICPCHNQPIEYGKKLEVVTSSFRTCFMCEQEKVINVFIRHKCCDAPICFDCADKFEICPRCNTAFNDRILKSIADYFKHRYS